ncbi:hypothetical protein [Clostridium massiliamazoniense]|uniref:hypothetical protein n=1 Tax=Clostridium massiliamazoniense TaxID=1347366 RepID=UPI000B0B34D2|nr:hypothetical protein [Clostridium massiliamazoniense]
MMNLCTIEKDLKYMNKGNINVSRDYDGTPYLAISIGDELITIIINENEFKALTKKLGE